MNREIQAEWLSELQSGRYKKGIGRLKTVNNEFCCLGVLCDMYAKKHNKKWMSSGTPPSLNSEKTEIELFEGESNYPPTAVLVWAGIADGDSDAGYGVSFTLATVNDESETFNPVIEVIKKL